MTTPNNLIPRHLAAKILEDLELLAPTLMMETIQPFGLVVKIPIAGAKLLIEIAKSNGAMARM